MTFAASLLLLFCALLAAAGAIGLSVAFGARWAGIVTVLTVCAVFVGFDLGSHAIPGTVIRKTEDLQVSRHGLNPSIIRRLNLSIAVTPAATVDLDTSERLFDALHEGDPIVLRGLRFGPLIFARPEAASWWNAALDAIARWLPATPLGPLNAASASVISMHTIRDAYAFSLLGNGGNSDTHVLLRQPYDEIRFRFLSEDGVPIVALDRVDTGSAGVLSPGGSVAIVFYRDRPRTALLSNGRRSFRWRNTMNFWGAQLIVGGVILALIVTISAAGKMLVRRSQSIRAARRR